MSRFWWTMVRALAWVVVRVYYRRFDVAGRASVPADGPLLVVVNHPNSLLDAAALVLALPRAVRVGAKEPLFRAPVIGGLMRRVGAIPIHRRQDAGSDPGRNKETYRAYVDALHSGHACAIFPEGFTHVEPALQYIKAGAARIAVQAEQERADGPPLAILPVGLIFRPAQAFRGDAHVRIGTPFGIEELAGQPRETSIPALQKRMRQSLVRLMIHLDNVDLQPLITDVARIWERGKRHDDDAGTRASRADVERLASRCLNHFVATDPDVVEAVRDRHAVYRRYADDVGIGLDSIELRDRPFHWTLEFTGLCLQLLFGLPLFVAGMLVAYMPARIADHAARRVSESNGGAVALPLARVLVGAVAFALFWTPLLWLFHIWSGKLVVTGAALALMVVSSLAVAAYRRRARAWQRRFIAVAPGFVRRRALARAVAARERLLWLLHECVLRYEAETGDRVLPTEAAKLRAVEQRQRRAFRMRRLAFVVGALTAAWLFAGQGAFRSHELARAKSPWLDLPAEQAGAQLASDATALVGYLDTLRAVDARSVELRREFREGKRNHYTPRDSAAVRDCLAQFLTCREGLLRLGWYYATTPEDRPQEERERAFLIAHAAIVELCARGMQLVETFGDDPIAMRRLNEADVAHGIPKGIYDDVRAALADRERLDRLIEGVAHFEELSRANALPEGPPWDRLVRRARRGAELVEELSGSVAQYDVRTRVGRILDRGDTGRYVVSALVSTWIGDARVRQRPDRPGLIAPEQLAWLREQLRPGDIILERRNWYLSNAFLPGFWPHAALYVGGIDGVRSLGIEDDPRVQPLLAELETPAEHGHELAVIEAISDGVVFTTLEHSAGEADAVCVLRPNLPPERVAECVARALSHRGKPYDFDFDFFSADKLVCTELVFQAYADDIDIAPVEVMGRRTLPALEYVKMWAADAEKDHARLLLVAFLDHDEEGGRAFEADGNALLTTLDRPGLTLLGAETGRPRFLSLPVLVLIALTVIALGLPRRRPIEQS